VSKLEAFRKMVSGELPGPPIGDLIGLRMTAIEVGSATFELDAGPQHASPLGTVHGGVLCDLADAAMGCAHAASLDDDESFTTLELKLNFLKPVWEGKLTAVGTVIKSGRTIGLAQCRVTDETGSLVAFGTSTLLTLRGDAASGR
jgi:uncharacterized protein (TIGR00369 family)